MFPNVVIKPSDAVSGKFLSLGTNEFGDACRYGQDLPYGYNSDRGIVSRRSKQKVVGSAVLSAFKNLPVVLGNALDAPQCPIVAGFGNGFCENRLDEGPHIEFQSESVHFGFRMSPEEPPDEIHGI